MKRTKAKKIVTVGYPPFDLRNMLRRAQIQNDRAKIFAESKLRKPRKKR